MGARTNYLRTFFVVSAVCALFLSSCDALFTENYFKKAGLGQIKASDLQGQTSDQLAAQAYTTSGQPSKTFFDALTTDATAKQSVLDTLETTYNDPTATSTDKQTAAALATQVELNTTEAGAIVNNIAGLLSNTTALSGTPTASQQQALISAIFPASLASDKTAFTAAVDALQSLMPTAGGGPLDALATSITNDGSTIEAGTAATLAQTAIIATVINSIDPAQVTDPATSQPYTSTAELLYALVTIPAGDPLAPTIGSSAISNLDVTTLTSGNIGTLISAAGLTSTVNGLLGN
jgi:hypothetical protein